VGYRYPVHFTNGLFADGNVLLKEVIVAGSACLPSSVLVVVDGGLYEHHRCLLKDISDYAHRHRDAIELAGTSLLVEGGEVCKNNPRWVRVVQEAIYKAGLCRHSYVMAVGGGAVTDMVGFAAATAHRGIRLIRVPTTVLAQADASIGVKNGVNAFGKKNFIGVFAPPWAVFNDFAFLHTLPQRDWIAGVAEAVKVALMKDGAFFDYIEEKASLLAQRDMEAMRQVIHRCAALHLQHIATSGDPFELGSSRPLDFGHWSAHKLEQLTQFRLNHGEAVAVGIALDMTYANRAGLLSGQDRDRVLNVLRDLGFALHVPELDASVLGGLQEFREHLGGRLTITLLSGIGKPVEVHKVDERQVMKSIEWLKRGQEEGTTVTARSRTINRRAEPSPAALQYSSAPRAKNRCWE
jgi:3-dehydroquinate synthase